MMWGILGIFWKQSIAWIPEAVGLPVASLKNYLTHHLLFFLRHKCCHKLPTFNRLFPYLSDDIIPTFDRRRACALCSDRVQGKIGRHVGGRTHKLQGQIYLPLYKHIHLLELSQGQAGDEKQDAPGWINPAHESYTKETPV
jgi:hypothetical protein